MWVMETDRYEINNEKEMGRGVGKRERETEKLGKQTESK